MEYFANLPSSHFDRPGEWAADMETRGWHGICASDHFWVGTSRYPHVFVTATRMACATTRIKLTTSFCNNLFRSPVEFAQAALALQQVSNGRFEAGLGAGWSEDEMVASGMTYPVPRDRVSMYVEATQIVSALLRTGQCQFDGDYYQIDISGDKQLGPTSDTPPLLVGSAGGPRAIREITPLVDRLEVKASARSTRGGHLDFSAMASVTEHEVKNQIERVKQANGDIPIGIFLLTTVGDNPAAKGIKDSLGNGYLGRFHGAADDVARALEDLEQSGIDRVQLTEMTPGSHNALWERLLS